jgi:hypothetical protein
MLKRLAGDHNLLPLATLGEAVEPVKNLARYAPLVQSAMASGKGIDKTTVTTRFVDALPAESLVAESFRESVRGMLVGGDDSEQLRSALRAKLVRWRNNDAQFQSVAQDSSC